jgi:hypothetical protein
VESVAVGQCDPAECACACGWLRFPPAARLIITLHDDGPSVSVDDLPRWVARQGILADALRRLVRAVRDHPQCGVVKEALDGWPGEMDGQPAILLFLGGGASL